MHCDDDDDDENMLLINHFSTLWLSGVQPVLTAAEYPSSGGFIELPRSLFTHSAYSQETIEMSVITDQPNGLLLWQGQTPSRANSKDFIALAIDSGKVQFRFTPFGY